MTSQDSFSPDDSGKTFLIVLTVLKCLFLMGNLSAGFNLTVALCFVHTPALGQWLHFK